jgi:hypothetical protein
MNPGVNMNRIGKKWCVAAMVAVVGIAGFGVGIAAQRRGLPEAVRKAVTQLFPNARITDMDREHKVIRMYEVELRQNGQEREAVVTDDGVVLEVEREINLDDAPRAVQKTLKRLSRRGRLSEVEEITVHGEIQVVKLESPRKIFEAEFRVGRREVEVRITEDGKIVGQDDEDDDDDDEDDDDDDEDDEDDDD